MNRPGVAVVGGGWSGLAAAVRLAERGVPVRVFEASRSLGGRARRIGSADAAPVLDNGQHILIGAYTRTLELMRTVGVPPDAVLLREPLYLLRPDGQGLALPRLPPPWNALLGIARARGWRWAERAALLRRAAAWRLAGFRCGPQATVADLCRGLPPAVLEHFIEPLCVSALNVAPEAASGSVFLRVLQDALFAAPGGSDLLLPRADLGQLLPDAAARWLTGRGAQIATGARVRRIRLDGPGWCVDDEPFAAVVLAAPAGEAARLARGVAAGDLNAAGADPHRAAVAAACATWATGAEALPHTAIATVYAQARPNPDGSVLPRAMLALPAAAGGPAQFVFDRGRLGGPAGLLAFVVSDARGDGAAIESAVIRGSAAALGLPGLRPVRTLVERRATFACTPATRRPRGTIAERFEAAGDHVEGPYPATLEGAVRAGEAAAERVLTALASR